MTVRTNLADQWDFIKVLQKEIDPESATDVTDFKKALASQKFKVDPILDAIFSIKTIISIWYKST